MTTIMEACAGAGMPQTFRLASAPVDRKPLTIKQVAKKAIEELTEIGEKYYTWNDSLSRHMVVWISETFEIEVNPSRGSDEEVLACMADRIDFLFKNILVSHLDLVSPLQNPILATSLISKEGSTGVEKHQEPWEEWLWNDYSKACDDICPGAPLRSPYTASDIETVESHLFALELTQWAHRVKSWLDSHSTLPPAAPSEKTAQLLLRKASSTAIVRVEAAGIDRKLYEIVPAPEVKRKVAEAKIINYSKFVQAAKKHEHEINRQYNECQHRGAFVRLQAKAREEIKKKVEESNRKVNELFKELRERQASMASLHTGETAGTISTINALKETLSAAEQQLKISQGLASQLNSQVGGLSGRVSHLKSRIEDMENRDSDEDCAIM